MPCELFYYIEGVSKLQNELLRTNDSYTEILEKHADTVFRLCLLYMRDIKDAEDIFQNVFLKLCKLKPLFNDDEHIKAWLIKVTSNECKNQLKSFWRKKVICYDEVLTSVSYANNKELINSVMTLPVKYRNVLYLHYFEGYKVEELAELLKINISTIKTHLKRGRELLKNQLIRGDYEYE